MPQPKDEIAIVIAGDYFGFWQDFELKSAIDSYTTFSFKAPWDPSRREFRDTFRPFSYHSVEVLLDLETQLTGTMLVNDPDFDSESSVITANGYARPAVFEDVNATPGTPLEFKKQKLRSIATQIADPFGIKIAMEGGEGAVFDKVKIDRGNKIQEFLVDLAKQRNFVITDTVDGDLLFWQSVEPGNPVARFVEGERPLVKIKPKFSPQDYYSEVTGYAKKKRGKAPVKWTEHNRWLEQPLRPLTFHLEDTERADAPEATKAKIGRMFANMVSYAIEGLPGWRDPQGNRWQRNTTVTVKAPRAMIYEETELVIREVTLTQTAEVKSTTLELCLPGAFNGKLPDFLPWDEGDRVKLFG